MASTPEGKATVDVMLGASQCGMRLMRNNNGGMYDNTGRFVYFGLGNEKKGDTKEMALGDKVGFTKVVITPEMVGKEVAIFTMLEIKPPSKLQSSYNKALRVYDSREAAQLRAINWVRNNGGLAWFASCATDVVTIYKAFIEELKK